MSKRSFQDESDGWIGSSQEFDQNMGQYGSNKRPNTWNPFLQQNHAYPPTYQNQDYIPTQASNGAPHPVGLNSYSTPNTTVTPDTGRTGDFYTPNTDFTPSTQHNPFDNNQFPPNSSMFPNVNRTLDFGQNLPVHNTHNEARYNDGHGNDAMPTPGPPLHNITCDPTNTAGISLGPGYVRWEDYSHMGINDSAAPNLAANAICGLGKGPMIEQERFANCYGKVPNHVPQPNSILVGGIHPQYHNGSLFQPSGNFPKLNNAHNTGPSYVQNDPYINTQMQMYEPMPQQYQSQVLHQHQIHAPHLVPNFQAPIATHIERWPDVKTQGQQPDNFQGPSGTTVSRPFATEPAADTKPKPASQSLNNGNPKTMAKEHKQPIIPLKMLPIDGVLHYPPAGDLVFTTKVIVSPRPESPISHKNANLMRRPPFDSSYHTRLRCCLANYFCGLRQKPPGFQLQFFNGSELNKSRSISISMVRKHS